MFLYSAASCKKTTYGSWYCYSCVVKTFHGIFLPHACQDYALPALTLEGLEFDPRSSHTKDWKMRLCLPLVDGLGFTLSGSG